MNRYDEGELWCGYWISDYRRQRYEWALRADGEVEGVRQNK